MLIEQSQQNEKNIHTQIFPGAAETLNPIFERGDQ